MQGQNPRLLADIPGQLRADGSPGAAVRIPEKSHHCGSSQRVDGPEDKGSSWLMTFAGLDDAPS